MKDRILRLAREAGLKIKAYSEPWLVRTVSAQAGDDADDAALIASIKSAAETHRDQFHAAARVGDMSPEARLDLANAAPRAVKQNTPPPARTMQTDLGRQWLARLNPAQRLDFAHGAFDPPKYIQVAEAAAQKEHKQDE